VLHLAISRAFAARICFGREDPFQSPQIGHDFGPLDEKPLGVAVMNRQARYPPGDLRYRQPTQGIRANRRTFGGLP